MKDRYEIQFVSKPGDSHFRVVEIATDSRIATCYLRDNAELVAAALNAYRPVLNDATS